MVPVLLGPTASGKSAVAMALAGITPCEIISCDSRQIYRFMNIGTAKPSGEDRRQTPHRLIDIRDPSESYSASAFAADALAAIRACIRKGHLPLIVGGTGLYFESLRRGIGPLVDSDPVLRAKLMRRAAEEGSAVLHGELAVVDPEAALSIHDNDVQRIVRALTVFHQTGAQISMLRRAGCAPADLEFSVAVMMPPRALLYERINRRVDGMLRMGLWEEFIALRQRGYDESSPGLHCLGYKELFAVQRGECSLDAAADRIKMNTRRYAKRQITWFRVHNGDAITFGNENFEAIAARVIAPFRAKCPPPERDGLPQSPSLSVILPG
jgi:tRNA dimethylallyltransferase